MPPTISPFLLKNINASNMRIFIAVIIKLATLDDYAKSDKGDAFV